jgi:hypothetical protein
MRRPAIRRPPAILIKAAALRRLRRLARLRRASVAGLHKLPPGFPLCLERGPLRAPILPALPPASALGGFCGAGHKSRTEAANNAKPDCQ